MAHTERVAFLLSLSCHTAQPLLNLEIGKRFSDERPVTAEQHPQSALKATQTDYNKTIATTRANAVIRFRFRFLLTVIE